MKDNSETNIGLLNNLMHRVSVSVSSFHCFFHRSLNEIVLDLNVPLCSGSKSENRISMAKYVACARAYICVQY